MPDWDHFLVASKKIYISPSSIRQQLLNVIFASLKVSDRVQKHRLGTSFRGNVCNKFCATLLFFAVSIVCLHSSSRMQLRRCFLPPSYSPHKIKLDECSLQGPSDLPRNNTTPSPMIDSVDWKIRTKLRPHRQRVQCK